MTIPSSAALGDHRIYGVGKTSNLRVGQTFTVKAPVLTLSLVPTTGEIGSTVATTGSGFQAGETVKIYLDTASGTALTSVRADTAGSFTASFKIPQTTGGGHRIHAVGQSSKTRTAQSLVVIPSLTPSVTSGQARVTFNVAVKGFAANESVSLYWDGNSTAETTATVDATGTATFSTKAPWTNGSHTAVVKGATSNLSKSFTFTVTAKIKLTPTSGDSATSFEVRGTGFAPATTVKVYWGTAETGTLLCSQRTSSTYGTLTCTVTPPANATVGTATLTAIGGGVTTTASFRVTAIAAKQSSLTEATPVPAASTAAVSPTPEASATVEATPEATAEPTETPAGEPTEVVTEAPVAEPTEAPTDVATEVPTETPTPEPVQQTLVLQPIADASVSSVAPEQVASADQPELLPIGGEAGSVAAITFQVQGISAGTVVSATLVLTGAGDVSGSGGAVSIISGYSFDESSISYAALPIRVCLRGYRRQRRRRLRRLVRPRRRGQDRRHWIGHSRRHGHLLDWRRPHGGGGHCQSRERGAAAARAHGAATGLSAREDGKRLSKYVEICRGVRQCLGRFPANEYGIRLNTICLVPASL